MEDLRALSDAALVAEVAQGERAALAELYARHAPVLLSRLDRRCADRGLVEEAVQDTFAAALLAVYLWAIHRWARPLPAPGTPPARPPRRSPPTALSTLD